MLLAFLSRHGDKCGFGSNFGLSESGDLARSDGFGGVGWNCGIRRKSNRVSSSAGLFERILGEPSVPDVELLLEDDRK